MDPRELEILEIEFRDVDMELRLVEIDWEDCDDWEIELNAAQL